MTNQANNLQSSISPEKDFVYSIELNRRFLKMIGAWPSSLYLTTLGKIGSVIVTVISISLIGFLFVPCALCTLLENEVDLDMKIKMIGPLSFCTMAAIKYYILISRGKPLEKCMEHIRADWQRTIEESNLRDREVMIDSAKFGRFLAIFCAAFMYSGGFFYRILMPLCAKRTEIIDNETVRSQAVPIYRSLLDPRTSPSFELVQLLRGLAGFVLYSVTVSACSLAAVFVMHACGQFKILMFRLNDVVNKLKQSGKEDTLEKKLRYVVDHHLRIINFIALVETLLHEICLVELVGCTLNICFLGYYLLTEWEQSETIGILTYFTLLISLTFNIFILCYIGEILTEECKKVGLMAYMIEWYRLPGKQPLDLILVVAMSNSCIRLTAGKFVELSLSSFCSVVKSALAYLSLLRTLTQ